MKLVLILISVLFFTSCETTSKFKNISPEVFFANQRTIALSGLRIPRPLADRSDIFEFYEKHVHQILTLNGVNFLPEDVYNDEFDKQNNLAGGYFDPKTGQENLEKLRKIRLSTNRALEKSHGVDSILNYRVVESTAFFDNFVARWDGQTQPYKLENSKLANFLTALFLMESGRVSALTFVASIEDLNSTQLFLGTGGIELTSLLSSRPMTEDELAKSHQPVKRNGPSKRPHKTNVTIFKPVALNSLLRNENIMAFSINRAFNDLFEKQLELLDD